MPDPLQHLVVDELKVAREDVFTLEQMVGLADLSQLIVSERPDLLWPPFNARFPERIRDFGGDCFAAIRTKDIIVHHPYESFYVIGTASFTERVCNYVYISVVSIFLQINTFIYSSISFFLFFYI